MMRMGEEVVFQGATNMLTKSAYHVTRIQHSDWLRSVLILPTSISMILITRTKESTTHMYSRNLSSNLVINEDEIITQIASSACTVPSLIYSIRAFTF